MTPETFIKAELARYCIEHAAHYGGRDNMIALAFMLKNRERAGWGDMPHIIERADYLGEPQAGHLWERVRDPNVRGFLALVEDIWSGHAVDSYTEGALHCCELRWVADCCDIFLNAQSFKAAILDQPEAHPRVAQVGPVTFFK